MMRLTSTQIEKKLKFIGQYLDKKNAADSSAMDANANVSSKNIATLETEINKDINIQVNRALMQKKISEIFSEDLAQEYVRQIEEHEIYVHDETSLKPYCVSVTMYPLLLDGLLKMGGESKAPQHLGSFCGTFINFVFAISSQFAGAVATVEFLTYFDYFARKDFGDNYLQEHSSEINAYLQQVVYSINQPAAARGYQSVFWNISVYDQYYFASMFKDFHFPDGKKPAWSSVNLLQQHFLKWFNQERKKSLLTFPVVTAAVLTENGRAKDRAFSQFLSHELADGNSFFIYSSPTADSLASCCRLRNEISDNTFSYTLGAGGVATGSINVITLNLNRIVQKNLDLAQQVQKVQNYQVAYRSLMQQFLQAGLLTSYDAGFISLDKQYLTLGINGLVESAEYLNIKVGNNPEYEKYVNDTLSVIYDLNQTARKKYGFMFNTEFVPAENLGVKNSRWDEKDGLFSPRDCYNSYFYIVEDESINVRDKFILHGENFTRYLDGGSALHLNLEEHLSAAQYEKLIDYACKSGCNYFCTNVKVTVCNDCHHIDKKTLHWCSKCGSENIDYATRVIGYLKKVTSFSSGRRKEHKKRFYHLEKPQSLASQKPEPVFQPTL